MATRPCRHHSSLRTSLWKVRRLGTSRPAPPGQTVAALSAQVDRLTHRLSRLEEELGTERHRCFVAERSVQELEARLLKNSANSSRPPSTDPPWVKKRTGSLRQPSGKKAGGQPQHRGSTLQQVRQPDEVVVHSPSQCRGCGESLTGGRITGCERRQVFDLPPVKFLAGDGASSTTKHCGSCGHWTRGQFPLGVAAPVQYGPGIRARCLYLLNYQLLPYNRTAELMSDLFRCRLSRATLYGIVQEGAENLIETEVELKDRLRRARTLHVDETGMRVASRLHYVHVASSELMHYGCHTRRGTRAMDEDPESYHALAGRWSMTAGRPTGNTAVPVMRSAMRTSYANCSSSFRKSLDSGRGRNR